jgi:hypothetical protein
VDRASVDTSKTAMLSGRTNATITLAAPTMSPPEALPGDVYARGGEKLAEVAREDPVAARTIEEGASAPMTAYVRCVAGDRPRCGADRLLVPD